MLAPTDYEISEVEDGQQAMPKLSATAHVNFDFARELEKALERAWGRSAEANLPRLNGPVEQLPAEELKRPFPNYRNNLRRF
jgi:hypothetical protein